MVWFTRLVYSVDTSLYAGLVFVGIDRQVWVWCGHFCTGNVSMSAVGSLGHWCPCHATGGAVTAVAASAGGGGEEAAEQKEEEKKEEKKEESEESDDDMGFGLFD